MVATSERAGTREWLGLTVLVLPVLLISVDVSVLFIALPSISADLQPSSSQLLWFADIYAFVLAGLLVTMGSVGDRIGRRKLLMLGALGFGAASVLVAYSSSPAMLIAARAIQGFAGATLMPSTLSLIRNMFHDRQQRARAIGIWTTATSAGMVLGPVVGGILLEHFWWGSVFLINVPVMVALLLLAPSLVPEYRHPRASRFDLLSSAMWLAAVLPVVYGIKRIAEESAVDATATACIAAGLLLAYLFVRRQRALTDPMFDVTLFRQRGFATAISTNTLVFFGMSGLTLFTVQYLQLVLGMSPLRAGLWSLIGAVGAAIGATVGPTLLNQYRHAHILGLGLVIAAGGFTVMTQVGLDSLALLLTANAIAAVGIGMVVALVTDIAVASAPPERAGATSAMAETSTEFGGALGIAALGSIGNLVYGRAIEEDLPPGLPAEAAEPISHTLATAVEVAASLPGDVSTAVLEAARSAFTEGLHVLAIFSACVMLLLAVLAFSMLRHVTVVAAPSDPHDVDDPDDGTEGAGADAAAGSGAAVPGQSAPTEKTGKE
ncbi:MFS transporter [Streptomyces sp. DSM 44915]|uniref:MFS transporter n=1 Tax=Streptomyces chisholmiae TaxID=3075540 RepID=A0ABU2JSU5_9ACTN|nr:MFS transporter [Streptomyces sp. DSM 44915]MDT0268064.1 MFS transporter [Streptomyces sp. DSM 44915]